MDDAEYFAIKSRAAKQLFKIPGVTVVGMGGRERAGQPTGEIVIKVFVERKVPPEVVPPGQLIPGSFEGVPTDVVEMGPIKPRLEPVPGVIAPGPNSTDMSRTDPLQGGIVIGIEPDHSGTLGCFLRDKEDGSAVYGLTNAHVVDHEGRISLSRRVMPAEGTGAFDPRRVGYVAAAVHDAAVDAALVRLDADIDWLPSIKEIGFVTGTFEITLAEVVTESYNVRKRGARTGLTGGVVISIGAEHAEVPGARKHDIIIRPNLPAPPNETAQAYFADSGDSGSVVVNDDNEVVALFWGSDDIAGRPHLTHSLAAAIPIHVVFDRFRKVHHLDVDVAIPAAANPTEAAEKQRVLPPAGAPRVDAPVFLERSDRRHDRPLSGGSQVVADPFGSANAGALGCMLTSATDPDAAFILTSHDRLSGNGSVPLTTDTDVGQPDNEGSCSDCCSNTVGDFSKGGPAEGVPTAAIVKLLGDQRWVAEVMQIGFLSGITIVTSSHVNSGIFQVRKRGPGSRLTGGVVVAVGGVAGTLPPGVRPDAMLVRPNPNPLKPGQDLLFSRVNDRGAVLVDQDNKVVGLLYDEIEIPQGGVNVVHGVATPIDVVLDALNAVPGVDVAVASATAPDQVKTTASRTTTRLDPALPPTVPSPAPKSVVEPEGHAHAPWEAWTFDRLQGELSASVAGRLATRMWNEHRGEIRQLVNTNRRVAVVWHRSGGPALLQALIRMVRMPAATVPSVVNGLPIDTCLDRVAGVLCEHGSGTLRTDLAALRGRLPPVAGLSLAEILVALKGS